MGWYSDASVFLWEKEKDELHQVAGSEHFDVGLRLSRGKGVVWRAFASGKPILVKDVRRGSVPNTFTLLSVNADPIEDVGLDWAARVVSIRPA